MTTIFDRTPHHFSQKVKLKKDKSKEFSDELHNIFWRLTLKDRNEFCTLKVEISRYWDLPVIVESLRISPSSRSGLEPGDSFQQLFYTPPRNNGSGVKWQTLLETLFICPVAFMDHCVLDVSFRRGLWFERGECECTPRSDSSSTSSPSAMYATLSSDLAKQFGDEATADVTFVVDDRLFPAHKWILQARLPYFQSMFSSQMLEATTNRVHIKDTDPTSFGHMLKFIYCGQLPDSFSSIASSLLPLADKYGVDQLKAACVTRLTGSLERANAVETLLLAEMYGCPELKEVCIRKLNRWKDGMEPAEFDPLKEHPSLLLEMYIFKKKSKAAQVESEAESESDQDQDEEEEEEDSDSDADNDVESD